jgi:RHS repeat-associated protein
VSGWCRKSGAYGTGRGCDTSPQVGRCRALDGATYTVDNAGNRTAKSDLYAGVTTNYGYDAIYELLNAAQGGSTTESYTYDAVGNRLTSLGSATWSYNTSNELNSRPGLSYAYDYNGNTIVKTDSTGSTSYTWDYENRMTSVVLPGSGGTVSFKYDPFGRRIYKSSSSGTSIFAYDGDSLVEETNAAGTAVARYTQTENIDEPLAMLRSSTTSYYQADGLGSVTSLSNAAGVLPQTYSYDSFGKQLSSTGSLTNPFQYTAREFDSETSLYYYRARYYDTISGRFISEDPIGFNSGQDNFYAYAGNSPVRNVDPSGLAHCIVSLSALGANGVMICYPDKPGNETLAFPVNSGNNGDPEHKCQNNPACPPTGHGPLPLGPYKFGGPSISHKRLGGIHLIPVGKNNQFGADGRFLTHSCLRALESQTTPYANGHFCTEGCIVSTPENIKALNDLLAKELGSILSVNP